MASVTAARPPREAGFSLLELIVSLLLLLLIFALAAQLLVESARIHASAARELRTTEDQFALRTLRADLRSGVPAGAWSDQWTSEPLVLREGARAIAWAADSERLIRAEAHEEDATPVERVQLDGVLAFRWRVPVPGLFDIEIVRRRPEHAPLARILSAEWRRQGETLEVATLSIAARRSWW